MSASSLAPANTSTGPNHSDEAQVSKLMGTAPRTRAALCAALEVVTVTVGLLTVAGFFGRQGWLYELASHFRVQYFWPLAACALGLAVLGRRRWALAGATLALANGVVIVPLYVGPARPNATGPTLRVMTLNLFHDNREFDKVLDLVRSEDPDFALFLEVTSEWAAALRALDDAYPYHRIVPSPGSSGMAFYSRIQAVSLQFRQAGGMPTMVARLVGKSGPLTVIGVHPESPRTPAALEFRNIDLGVLQWMVNRERGPLVVLGDLNTSSWSPYFQNLLQLTGLVDTRRGFGIEGTWPNLPLPFRIPIDHCLVSKDIAVCNRRVGPSVGSDHRPVIIDLLPAAEE